ncbi:MAG TPA: Calx-beta domain-containing protein [Verrucomicrobiae bacterium]|nr:Calx-beta domain-containing protein [Verrucomicrobiae bacterium]
MRKFTLFITALALLAATVRADVEPIDYAFLLSAQAVANPPSITIRWPQKPVPQINIRRKLLTDANWGPIVTLAGDATTYTDTSILAGRAYEYEFQGIVQANPQQIAYGYICAGANVATDESRGKVLLLVDNRFAAALAPELETLRKDLLGDGWKVVRRDVSPNSPPPEVKSQIRAEYNADPANMRAVFLIGHIAVPYSGVLNPDMHPDHLGAWPADVYYGEMDGEWTDYSAYKTGSTYPWNDNVPGDGKFDQSTIPGRVELQVGRVDFDDMPSFLPRTELDLLRNYLRKDHAFRHRTLNAALRGLIRDNFQTIDGDAPATDAWRAFPALFGPGNYIENGYNQFFPVLQNESYLFAYAGGGGDWEKADGVGTTANFVNGDPQAIFYLLHGSYFGDWNTMDNFLRSAIATPNYGLVSIWSSLPHWYFHPMALGETIGFATQLTQNNRNGNYRNSADLSIGQVHISMMGDPTLRAFPLAPPSNFQIGISDKLSFNWNPSWQAVEGYNIYYATSYDAPFTKTSRRPIAGNYFEMPLLPAGHYIFMIKSSALQTTGSGSFNNLSQGIFLEADLTGTPPPTPQVTITASDATGNEDGDAITFTVSRDTGINNGLTVNLQFAGSATLGQDYQASTTVSFQPGNSVATITITPTKDSTIEAAETIIATLLAGSGYALGTPSSATATIAADPPPPLPTVTIVVTDPIATEQGVSMLFTLTRTGPLDTWLTVSFQVSGTVTPDDYYIMDGTNTTFVPGASNAWVRVWAAPDGKDELDETVVVTLTNGPDYKLGAVISAEGTIKGSGECKISDAKLSTGRTFSFQATGFANRPYRIEARTPTGAWTARTNAVAGADGTVKYNETKAVTGACVYYRIVWE